MKDLTMSDDSDPPYKDASFVDYQFESSLAMNILFMVPFIIMTILHSSPLLQNLLKMNPRRAHDKSCFRRIDCKRRHIKACMLHPWPKSFSNTHILCRLVQ